MNLFIINEIYTNGFIYNVLDIFSIMAIYCAILVITSKNPIVSVLFLIGLFLCISSYLITIGLSFVGLSYLIVYIGAVSILFLFILMLINIRISELQNNTTNSIILSMIILIIFNYLIYPILPYEVGTNYNFEGIIDWNLNSNTYNAHVSNIKDKLIFFVTSVLWDGNLAESNHITTIGNVMYTNYNIWLIISSFILLLAMVGAIVITLKK